MTFKRFLRPCSRKGLWFRLLKTLINMAMPCLKTPWVKKASMPNQWTCKSPNRPIGNHVPTGNAENNVQHHIQVVVLESIFNARVLNLVGFLSDSDSESQTSSTEDGVSPQASVGVRGPQKRPRKKPPAPQVPRNVAIPVAMPKVPSVIPPRQPPPPRSIESEQGKNIFPGFFCLSKFVFLNVHISLLFLYDFGL